MVQKRQRGKRGMAGAPSSLNVGRMAGPSGFDQIIKDAVKTHNQVEVRSDQEIREEKAMKVVVECDS